MVLSKLYLQIFGCSQVFPCLYHWLLKWWVEQNDLSLIIKGPWIKELEEVTVKHIYLNFLSENLAYQISLGSKNSTEAEKLHNRNKLTLGKKGIVIVMIH